MARHAKPAPQKAQKANAPDTKGKRIAFDQETWQALDVLARERMMTFQELADEAFRDVLSKHGRPYDTLDAFRKSAKAIAKPSAQEPKSTAPKKSAKQPKKKTARQGGGRARS